MNPLADESIDAPIVARVRADGHQVDYVAEMSPSLPDDLVLDRANARKALLITADRDFGELVFRQHRVSPGVALIRLAGLSPSLKASVVAQALRARGQEMERAFSVITAGMVRIRREREPSAADRRPSSRPPGRG